MVVSLSICVGTFLNLVIHSGSSNLLDRLIPHLNPAQEFAELEFNLLIWTSLDYSVPAKIRLPL